MPEMKPKEPLKHPGYKPYESRAELIKEIVMTETHGVRIKHVIDRLENTNTYLWVD